jgi:hypothetical protein
MIKNNSQATIPLQLKSLGEKFLVKPGESIPSDITGWSKEIEQLMVKRWTPNLTYIEESVGSAKTILADEVTKVEEAVDTVLDDLKIDPTDKTDSAVKTTYPINSKGGK